MTRPIEMLEHEMRDRLAAKNTEIARLTAALAAAEERASRWIESSATAAAEWGITRKSMRKCEASLATARADALEEAAKVADEYPPSDLGEDSLAYGPAKHIAAAIRALKAESAP
jgi:hypothetical protein